MKVQQFYNKNQFVIKGAKEIIFQSYDSTIAIYNFADKSLTLGRDWDYSNTTRKHLYLFINDYVDINALMFLDEEKNKRAFIQKLIDNGTIKYDCYLI